jgi:cytosine/uracil/thiamine/allantoin permease
MSSRHFSTVSSFSIRGMGSMFDFFRFDFNFRSNFGTENSITHPCFRIIIKSKVKILLCLLIGILFLELFCDLCSMPSQRTGIPFPVISRFAFGIRGANIPAVVCVILTTAWYSVQVINTLSCRPITRQIFWKKM